MAKSIKFEDANTIVHILRDDDGSILVDLDEIALVLRKRGRKWMDDSDNTDVERNNMYVWLAGSNCGGDCLDNQAACV